MRIYLWANDGDKSVKRATYRSKKEMADRFFRDLLFITDAEWTSLTVRIEKDRVRFPERKTGGKNKKG